MALAYTPPGVFVDELATPSVTSALVAPGTLCLIGTARGYIPRTDQIALTNEDAIALPNFPRSTATLTEVVSVTNINTITPYVQGTDYSVNLNSAVNEVQIVTVTGASGGTFVLTFKEQTTATIDYDATAAEVLAALEGLDAIGAGDVAVAGADGGPWEITFQGIYANTNVEELTVDGSGLAGGGAAISIDTSVQGGVTGTISRIDGGGIAEGETVTVVYNYVPNTYYHPTRVDEQGLVEEIYGPAIKSDGSIDSPISYAARIAFENGARNIIMQALFRRATDGDPDSAREAPTDTEIQDSVTWEHALYALRDIEDVGIITPVIGQSFPGLNDSEWLAIAQKVQDHIKYMSDNEQRIMTILGEDSSLSSSVAQRDTLRSHAQTLKSRYGGETAQSTVLITPSKFGRRNPVDNSLQYIGGQYAAAGVAGMVASRPVAQNITRGVLSGFTEVPDYRSRADKNQDAAEGLCVVEQQANIVRVRHGITLDNTNASTREISVVRAKHRLMESVQVVLDETVIGKVPADGDAPATVISIVAGVLESLVGAGDIFAYRDIQARTLALEPDTVEVRFSYRPAFPLNYIRVQFSVDLTAGTAILT